MPIIVQSKHYTIIIITSNKGTLTFAFNCVLSTTKGYKCGFSMCVFVLSSTFTCCVCVHMCAHRHQLILHCCNGL